MYAQINHKNEKNRQMEIASKSILVASNLILAVSNLVHVRLTMALLDMPLIDTPHWPYTPT